MAVTIDRFELLPAQASAPAEQNAANPAAGGSAASPPPLSRHEILRALRLETSRAARVRAH